MFDILELFDGPVIPGLEQFEKVWAKDQPQYRAMRTLPGRGGDSAIGRFGLTENQRKAIAAGADIFLEILHFRGPLVPSLVMICDPTDNDTFRSWWKAQTQGPYKIDALPALRPDGVPRRIDSTLWAPAEKAIADAMRAVEEAGGSLPRGNR
jgi:hypothetical protein